MRIRLKIKNFLVTKKKSPFHIIPVLILFDSVKIAFPIYLFIFLAGSVYYNSRIELIVPLIVVAALCFLILSIVFLYQSRQIRKEKKDLAKNNLIEVDAILVSSESFAKRQMTFLPNLLGRLFWKEAGVYQKVNYKPINDVLEKDTFFYDFVTVEKVEIMRRFFDAKISFWGLDIRMKEGLFRKEVPLKLLIGKDSHMLQNVLPVDGYEYTDDEIAAFSELSRRYLRSDVSLVCEKVPYSSSRKKRREKFDRKKILPSRYIFAKLLQISVTTSLWCVGSLILIYDIICSAPIYAVVFFCLILGFYFGKRSSYGKYVSTSLLSLDQRCQHLEILDVVLKKSLNPEEFFPSDSAAGEATYRDFDDLWLIFKEEMASVQRCYYWKVGRFVNGKAYCNQTDYFNFILSREKLDLLRLFYQIRPEVSASEEKMPCFEYKSDVPLRITITKNSNVLKQIGPVEGYDYTEAQLAAIEKFNTLYP